MAFHKNAKLLFEEIGDTNKFAIDVTKYFFIGKKNKKNNQNATDNA